MNNNAMEKIEKVSVDGLRSVQLQRMKKNVATCLSEQVRFIRKRNLMML